MRVCQKANIRVLDCHHSTHARVRVRERVPGQTQLKAPAPSPCLVRSTWSRLLPSVAITQLTHTQAYHCLPSAAIPRLTHTQAYHCIQGQDLRTRISHSSTISSSSSRNTSTNARGRMACENGWRRKDVKMERFLRLVCSHPALRPTFSNGLCA